MRKPKVVVGMSGGIDSSAAAAILVDQGYDVEGVTLKVWHEGDNPDRRWQDRSCCKVGLARYVAKRLGFPHHEIDVQGAFREAVIEDFINGYMAGETPNPCVRCNERIKFGYLFRVAQDLGADFLATGHYARIGKDDQGNPFLKEGIDQAKDQSYFLYRLKPAVLSRLIFPLGSTLKSDTMRWIESLDLPPDEMRESQEICFVTEGDYREFLTREAPETSRPGRFVTEQGEELGDHRGIAFYTIGQRRGLGIASPHKGKRLYVLGLDPATDQVRVGTETELYSDGITVRDINNLGWDAASSLSDIEARFRYRGPKVTASLKPVKDQRMRLTFKVPQRAVSPGQSVVFYRGDRVLGGGIIETVSSVKTPVC